MAGVVGIHGHRRGDAEAAFERGLDARGVERHGAAGGGIPHQRLRAVGVAQVEAVGADQVGRGRAVAQEGQVELPEAVLAHQHVDQREHEGGVGLGADRHPLGRTGAGDRQVGLDLHALVAAHARVGVAGDRARAAGGVDVAADRDHVAAVGRVRGDGEGAVPELAVEVLGMHALDALAGAEAEVDRPPGGEEGGQGAHVHRRRAAMAEAGRHARQAGVVDEALLAHRGEAGGDGIERLVPGDRYEARILVAPLLRVGALHRLQDAVRVVGLLHQAVRLHAYAAARGMHVGGGEVGFDLGGHAVDHLDGHEVGAGDAVVAVARNLAFVAGGGGGHRGLLAQCMRCGWV